MADVVLRLKIENADLKAKLSESEAAVASLTAEVEKLKTAGGATQELEKNFEELEKQAYNTQRALEENNRQLAEAKQKTLDAAKATKDKTGALGGLTDGLTKAQKALGGGIAAILAFREAYTKTRSTIEFFKKQFGLDIDEMVTKSLGLEAIAERWVGVTDAQRKAGEGSEEVLAKFEALHKKHFEAAEAARQHAAAFDEFTKATTGFSAEELISELERLKGIQEDLAAAGELDGVLGQELQKKIDKATGAVKAYGGTLEKELGPEKAAKLRALADSLRSTAEESERLGEAQEKLSKETAAVVSELEKQAASLDKARTGINDLAHDAGDSLDRLIGKFEDLGEAQQPKQVVEYKDQITKLTNEYDALSEAIVTTQENEDRRVEILEEIDALTAKVAQTHSKASREAQEAQADLNRLLSDYERQVQALPAEVQPALEAIIGKWRFHNEQVGANADTVREFKTEWVANLDIARRTVEGFGDQTQVAMNKVEGAAKTAAEGVGAAWDEASSHADSYLAKLDAIIAKHQEVVAGMPSIADAAEEAF